MKLRPLPIVIIVFVATVAAAAPVREKAALEPETVTFALKVANAADVVDLVKQVFQGAPSLSVELLPKTNSIRVRANPKTMRDVRDLIRHVEDMADAKPLAPIPKAIAWRGGLADPKEFNALIRAIQGMPTYDNAGNPIDGDRAPGAFVPGGSRRLKGG